VFLLHIGLDIKVISPALFSMMVIMALVTTFMTTPVLSLICPKGVLDEGAAVKHPLSRAQPRQSACGKAKATPPRQTSYGQP
jgi:hypothetical protein